jgi:hypothetical protein
MADRHGRVPMPAVLEPPEGLIDEEQRIRYIQLLRPQPLRSFTDPVRLTGAVDALRSAFIRCTRAAPPGDSIAAVAAQPALADGRIESWLLPTTRSFLTRTAPWTCSTTSRRPCESGVLGAAPMQAVRHTLGCARSSSLAASVRCEGSGPADCCSSIPASAATHARRSQLRVASVLGSTKFWGTCSSTTRCPARRTLRLERVADEVPRFGGAPRLWPV